MNCVSASVDDFNTVSAQTLAAGARQEQILVGPKHRSAAFCSDPFGHGFCIIERRRKAGTGGAP